MQHKPPWSYPRIDSSKFQYLTGIFYWHLKPKNKKSLKILYLPIFNIKIIPPKNKTYKNCQQEVESTYPMGENRQGKQWRETHQSGQSYMFVGGSPNQKKFSMTYIHIVIHTYTYKICHYKKDTGNPTVNYFNLTVAKMHVLPRQNL